VQQHFDLLGKKATDSVTGFHGVVTSVCFDLYGCIQVLLTPTVDEDGKKREGYWMDTTRLTKVGKKPVMQLPDYNQGYVADGKKGPAEKPGKSI